MRIAISLTYDWIIDYVCMYIHIEIVELNPRLKQGFDRVVIDNINDIILVEKKTT